jgi:pimeloyl-ACP methyl ester carboxylesterase
MLIALVSISTFGQEITGQWNGVLNIQGVQLRIVFNITKSTTGFNATMDSPDQGATDIPVTTTTFENSKLKLVIASAGIEYNGEFLKDSITGTFKQSGYEFPMKLSRELVKKQAVKRPQEPTKPYSYHSEEVFFINTQANITLAGTLTLPKKEGNFPAVILISGSGPQNRDEEVFSHKPFLIISDHLTKNGIAVLRCDDRGVGQSTGDFSLATSLDFASDVESAISYLMTRKEINNEKIGLIGHSEGGIIAPMVAAKSNDVNFIVLLAGTGIRGDKLLLLQQALIAKAYGASDTAIQKSKEINSKIFEIVIDSKDMQSLKSDLTNYLREFLENSPDNAVPEGMSVDDFVAQQVTQISTPWMEHFIKYDPSQDLEKVTCAVLAVNGEKDLQVPPKENLTAISDALKKGGNNKVTIKEFPNLNHLFQECITGSPSEYANIEQTFSPIALNEITQWILSQTK